MGAEGRAVSACEGFVQGGGLFQGAVEGLF